jgi:hypothetical protein
VMRRIIKIIFGTYELFGIEPEIPIFAAVANEWRVSKAALRCHDSIKNK